MNKKLYTILFFTLSFFFFIDNAKALTINENFDSYSTGALAGQGVWTTVGTSFDVTSAQSVSPSNSLGQPGGGSKSNDSNTFTALDSWILEFDFYDTGTGNPFNFNANPSTDNSQMAQFGFVCGNGNRVGIGTDGGAQCETYSSNTWYHFKVEYDDPNQQIRYDFDNTGWSIWYAQTGETLDNVTQIRFAGFTTADIYVDNVEFGSGAPTAVSIDFVPAFIETGQHVFTGGCAVNATDRLVLTDGYYFQSPTEVNDFNIDCSSNTWTATSTIYASGPHEKRIFDLDWLQDPQTTATTTAYVAYTGVEDSYSYQLAIIYPTMPDTGNLLEIQESTDWIFRFGYGSTPSNTTFVLDKLCDSGYNNCTTAMNNSLSYYDPDGNGYFDTISNAVIASSTIGYYVANLVDSGSVVRNQLFFRTIGSTATNTQQALPPGSQDCSALCQTIKFMFVPSTNIMNLYANALPSLLQSKKPFSYFYEVKNQLTNVSVASTTLAFGLDMSFAGATMTIPFLNSNETHLKTITDTARPYIVLLLWGLMTILMIERIIHLDL